MIIEKSILDDFAKSTNDRASSEKEYMTYATVTSVAQNGKEITVIFDGADNIQTPCITTVECDVGDRVIVSQKNRSAVVISNLSKKVVVIDHLIAERAEINELIAERATIAQLDAAVANVGELIAQRATIAQLNATQANLSSLISKRATISQLNASVATINSVVATKITADDLKATNIEFSGKLTGATGSFYGDVEAASLIAESGLWLHSVNDQTPRVAVGHSGDFSEGTYGPNVLVLNPSGHFRKTYLAGTVEINGSLTCPSGIYGPTDGGSETNAVFSRSIKWINLIYSSSADKYYLEVATDSNVIGIWQTV